MEYTAEAFDQMQLLWDVKRFNDHQLRCVLRFRHRLDAEALRNAVNSSIEAFPILGTRYVRGRKPHWTSLDEKDFGRAFVAARTDAEFEEFVAAKVDEGIGPQVRVCLLNAKPFALALKMNHMVCDAADFKAYLYFLCGLYTRGIPDSGNRRGEVTEDRSVRRVLASFGLVTRIKSAFLQSNQNNHAGGVPFPLSGGGGESKPLVLTRKLDREKTTAIKRYGQAQGATLNDVLLTAFYRCLFRRLDLRSGAVLRIPVMVDMRRYLAESGGVSSLTNFTSTVSTTLQCKSAESFGGTLRRVKALMDQRKRSNLGLNGFIKLDRAYRIFGAKIANRLLMSRMNHPLISMTNMGALDSDRMSFGDQRPWDALLCGSIKYKPYFQLSVSSYEEQLTLGINLLGNSIDQDRILTLFDELEAELPSWEWSPCAAVQAGRAREREMPRYATAATNRQEAELAATRYCELQTDSPK
jgi:NRPS condensation-like uncharacterized protein